MVCRAGCAVFGHPVVPWLAVRRDSAKASATDAWMGLGRAAPWLAVAAAACRRAQEGPPRPLEGTRTHPAEHLDWAPRAEARHWCCDWTTRLPRQRRQRPSALAGLQLGMQQNLLSGASAESRRASLASCQTFHRVDRPFCLPSSGVSWLMAWPSLWLTQQHHQECRIHRMTLGMHCHRR